MCRLLFINMKRLLISLLIISAPSVVSAQLTTKLTNSLGAVISPATSDNQTNGSQKTFVTGGTITANPSTRKTLDLNNTTTALLGSSATYTGTWTDTTNFVQAIVSLTTDKNAASGGLRLEVSDDGLSTDHAHVFSPTANTPEGHHYPSTLDGKFFRIIYTNGTTTQTHFHITTTLLTNSAEEGHVHPINYVIDDDHPASVGRSVLVAKKASGTYDNINSTNGGNLKISVEELNNVAGTQINPATEDTLANIYTRQGDGNQIVQARVYSGTTAIATRTFAADGLSDLSDSRLQVRSGIELVNGSSTDRLRGDSLNGADVDVTRLPASYEHEVSAGTVSGSLAINKFGNAPNGIQTTATDIWDRADATPTQQIWLAPTAARTHSIVSSSVSDTNGGAGARTIRLWGLKTWGTAESSEDITLTGTTSVNTVNSYVIIHRMKVLTMGASGPNVGIITATAATDATVTAQISVGNGQTEMAIYGVPTGKTGYLYRWGCGINKQASVVVDVDFRLLINENPDVQTVAFLRKDDISLQSNGTSMFDRHYSLPYKITGPAIVKVQATGSAADIDGDSGFDLEVK